MNESSITSIVDMITQKRFVEARDALDKAAPDGLNLYLIYQLGVGLVRAGQYHTAERAFLLLLRALPDQWEPAYALGVSLELQQQLGGAIAAFSLAVQLNPASPESIGKLRALQDAALGVQYPSM
jgi:Flp pilus assembly protein TadD